MSTYNSNLNPIAKHLRKSMTKEEKHLWYDFLKNYKYKFRRQYIIDNYIADFFCSAANLVIELDGSQHYQPDVMVKDQVRTEVIEQFGYTVLRFPNNLINNKFHDVCVYIDFYVRSHLTEKFLPQD